MPPPLPLLNAPCVVSWYRMRGRPAESMKTLLWGEDLSLVMGMVMAQYSLRLIITR